MLVDSIYLPPTDAGIAAFRPDLDSPQTLVLIFSGLPAPDMEIPIKTVQAAFPRSVVVGCSTAGEVLGATVLDGGMTIAVARFEHTRLTTASASIVDEGASFAGGVELARSLASDSLRAVLIFSDGLNVNGSELLNGLSSELDDSVVVTGGLAGDADRFSATWVVADGRPQPGFVTAVGLHGDNVRVGHGSRGGWDAFGPQRLVTRSEGNVVFELDGRPALDLYQEYLGELADGLPSSGLFFPLSIKPNADDMDSLVRTLLAVNHPDRSLTFAGDVPAGWSAQLMRANFDRLVEGAAAAAAQTSTRAEVSGDCLGLAISCVGRRLVLKDRVEEELEATVQGLAAGTRLVGFYSYGEISPLASGRCELHNQTMTLTTLSESSPSESSPSERQP
jgi:hypothetical protein